MDHIEFLGHVFSEDGMQLSDERVQGIRQIPEPTSLKAVRSFVGMVNYFRDSINGLSGHLIPLTELTKKRYSSEEFIFTDSARNSFEKIKDLLVQRTKLTIMNEQDPLVLYTDASTKAIAGVLMQIQGGIEKPCIFVSHALSEQASRWGIMELELYAFVYCVKQLSPYLMGKQFIVRTDHKNLIYLANSTVPKLVRWRIILSEFKYLIEHIPGVSNVVADGLTRVRFIQGKRHPDSKWYMYKDDSIERIFRLGGEDLLDGDKEGYVEEEDEECPSLEEKELSERFEIFSKYHNSIVGHFGIGNTLKAMSLGAATVEGHAERCHQVD
jgi:hypothetical protein